MDNAKALLVSEKEALIKDFEQFIDAKEINLTDAEKEQVGKAFYFALKAHGDTRRKTGEVYMFHPFNVAKIAAFELGLSATSIISALLHETIKNTPVTFEEIKKEFGVKVAEIVEGLTRIAGLYTHKVSFNAENFIKLLLTLATDVRIILLKIADRLHNIRTLDVLERERQLRIATETHDLYAPIAHRLGLYAIKTEFEELSMMFIYPEIYQSVFSKVEAAKGKQKDYIERFIEPIRTELDKTGFSYIVKGRTKSIYSIWKKMVNQGVDFEDVYDFFAIRVILDALPDKEKWECWHVYSIISDIYKPNPKRLRDWISNPKSSGYESLHTTVLGPDDRWIEVQIRTKRMDEVAEKGSAAHWKYKENSNATNTDEWLHVIRELIEKPNDSDFDKISSSKVELYSNEVFVFTPKGDLIRMPKGATLLDFAYRIHSGVGSRCTGARLGNKVVPIKYVLQNGDMLDIITSKTQAPSKDWLNIATTAPAKAKIRHALSVAMLKESLNGKEIFQRKIKNWKLTVTDEQINRLLPLFKLKTMVDFYYFIAKDKIDLIKVKEHLLNEEVVVGKPHHFQEKAPIKEVKVKDSELIIDGSSDKIGFELSKCCKPIFGDPIFGFVTVNGGVRIHHINCPNALQMRTRYPYRVIPSKWNTVSKSGIYSADLKISGFDEFGMLNSLSEVISKEFKINISSMQISSKGNLFEGVFSIHVDTTAQLDALIRRLVKVKGVEKVQRVAVTSG